MKKIIKLILIILWMIIIFNFSNQPAIESSKLSDGIILKSIKIIEKISHKTYNEDEILNKFVKPTRKLAHFTIYLILGILVLNYIKEFNINRMIIISILICLIYACSDEFHQLFVVGRSGEILDVIIDTLGSSIGIYIYNIFDKKRIK